MISILDSAALNARLFFPRPRTSSPPAGARDAAGTADRRFVVIPGRGHNDVSAHSLYWEALRAFVDHVAAG